MSMAAISQPTRRLLPVEILQRIIDSIDAKDLAAALFPLLTVSKDFFALAVERLYADPLAVLFNRPNFYLAASRFVDLITRVCPEVDQVLLAQVSIGMTKSLAVSSSTTIDIATSIPTTKTTPDLIPPYADYFSLIRVIHLRPHMEESIQEAAAEASAERRRQRQQQRLAATQGSEGTTLLAGAFDGVDGEEEEVDEVEPDLRWVSRLEPLFWMACGTQHRSKVREVSIHSIHVKPYNLEDSWIALFEAGRIETQMQQLENLLLGLKDVQKKQQQRSSKNFTLQLSSYKSKVIWYDYDRLYHLLFRLFDTLACGGSDGDDEDEDGRTGPPNMTRVESIYNDEHSMHCDPHWIQFYVLPDSIDLASVHCIRQYIPGYMQDNIRRWPKAGKTAILQQCRQLRDLGIYVGDGEDETLFAWARQERQQILSCSSTLGSASRSSPSYSPSSSLRRRPIPLERLQLGAPWGTTMDCSLRDALFAFGATLQYIRLDAGGMEIDLRLFQNLPELRELAIDTGILYCDLPSSSSSSFPSSPSSSSSPLSDIAMFSGCPRLESITLYEDGDGLAREGLLIWPGLTRLRKLTLMGPIAYRIDQGSLAAASGKSLEELTLYSEVMGQSPAEAAFTWDQIAWTGLSRLRKLQLRGAMAVAFRGDMLATCPELRTVELGGPSDMYYELQPRDLGACCFKPAAVAVAAKGGKEGDTDKVETERVMPSKVTQLDLSGWILSSTVVETMLPAYFPALEQLVVYNCNPSTISLERSTAIKGAFPMLKQLSWK
ncbi:hypothetical protein BGZ73_007946 [Actinomortierella ambigua]|nr:hypothetical protein BGZ73_007946 [Actinomortierella ambigua]